MLKIKSILVSLLAIGALASCSNDNEIIQEGGDERDYGVAYMSISVSTPKTVVTRASGEVNATEAETIINELFLIMFDENYQVVKDEDAPNAYISLTGGALNSAGTAPKEPFKVSPSTKYLLVIANPGAILKPALTSRVVVGATYASINAAITLTATGADDNTYLVDEITNTVKGYTMINTGVYDATTKWNNGLYDVTGAVVAVTDGKTEADVKAEAMNKKVTLSIERLASKMEVTLASPVVLNPTVGQFVFKNWTVDYVNSKFFPFATKTLTASGHAAGGFYPSNFYTEDPNFDNGNYSDGIVKNVVTASNITNLKWYDLTDNNKIAYCIENTMDDTEQRFGAATRLVLKAQYAPWADTESDFELDEGWFQSYYGGNYTNYKNLTELVAAYNAAVAKATKTDAETALIADCDNFLDKLKTTYTSNTFPATFADLDQTTHLTPIATENGGQITKDNNISGLLWYQKSINYYYYEIRHDNAADTYMEYGKYGVVRNNYYTLNLKRVNGNGTPWYPEVDEPDEEIDKKGAYLYFDVSIAPWISWQTDFEI